MELTENEKVTAWKIINWLEEPCPHDITCLHRRRCQQCMNRLRGMLRSNPIAELERWKRFPGKF